MMVQYNCCIYTVNDGYNFDNKYNQNKSENLYGAQFNTIEMLFFQINHAIYKLTVCHFAPIIS